MNRWTPLAAVALALATPAHGQHRGPVTAIVNAPSGRLEVSQAGVFVNGVRRSEWSPTEGRAVCAAFDRLGDLVLGGGRPGRNGVLWFVRDGDLTSMRLGRDLVHAVLATPKGTVVGHADGGVYLVERVADGRRRSRLLYGHTAPCRDVVRLGGSRIVSVGRDGALVFFDLATAKERRVQDHTAGVDCVVVVSGERPAVASGALDGKVRLHDARGRLLHTWQHLGAPVQALETGADGRIFAGLGDGRVVALATGKPPVEVARFDRAIFSLRFVGDRLWAGSMGRAVDLRP